MKARREASYILTNYVGVEDAARLSGLSVRTVLELCKKRRARAVLIGGHYAISEKWAIAERERRSMPEGYITVTEAMKIAGVTRQRIHELIRKGTLDSISRRIGARRQLVWINRHSLELWTQAREAFNGKHQNTQKNGR